MDGDTGIYYHGLGWEVVRFAQECSLESEEQHVGISKELWNKENTRFFFNFPNAGSLKENETRELELYFDETPVEKMEFIIWEQPDLPPDWLSFSANVPDSFVGRLAAVQTLRVSYKGRPIKTFHLAGLKAAIPALDGCVDSIYRRDPFID